MMKYTVFSLKQESTSRRYSYKLQHFLEVSFIFMRNSYETNGLPFSIALLRTYFVVIVIDE